MRSLQGRSFEIDCAAWAGVVCHWCRLRPAVLMDHVIPKSRGGLTIPENLVPACSDCNTSKRNLLPEEWGAWLLQRARTMATTCPTCVAGPGEWCRSVRRVNRSRIIRLHETRRMAA